MNNINKKKRLFLFDVDGTLTHCSEEIDKNTVDALLKLKARDDCSLAIVGGSDYKKIVHQIKYPEIFDFIFSENGVVAHKNGEQYFEQNIIKYLGEQKLQELINYCLIYIAKLNLPKKRGTFIELRKGVINICPLGRNCSREDRKEFVDYNMKNDIINKFRLELVKEFTKFNLKFAIGGQTSIDCFPKEWDKRFCLQHIEGLYREIIFFGDRTQEGGNDFELYNDDRVIGQSVKSPEHTVELIYKYLNE